MEDKKVRKKASTTILKYSIEDDQPAIDAVREVQAELGGDFKKALRFVCVTGKAQAIEKAKQIQQLKAS